MKQLLQIKKDISPYKDFTNWHASLDSNLKRKYNSLLEIATDYDVKALSPRNMAALSFELYTADCIDRDQYMALSFQAELSPRFKDTIGALIEKKAAPDKQRDFTILWQKKLLFEESYPTNDLKSVKRIKYILNVLMALEGIARLADRLKKNDRQKQRETITRFPPLSLKRMDY